METFIETPKMSEILYEEFMEPLGISAYKLAQAIHVPVSRIQDILHDRRKVTVDTSLRLARFFGVSDRYFLDIQNDIDIRKLRISMADDIKMIHPYNTAVM
ncbi:HigA family addiction module antitoxin [Butyrivibrio sp. LB2008]|uniref:HigA family addiction module antitoxin n=1 Tax=Butyrivibrio sp. LB2008 TaxID=1408305 RepID=UPI00047ECA57|nr:HigA family addiction module antitoxin [Butyrivibrio sp. LB2008]